MTQRSEPFQFSDGPRDARIVFVGEAWGESEEREHVPFAGYSGKELFRMLWEVWSDVAPDEIALLRRMQQGDVWVMARREWITAAGMLFTNVFCQRPPNNNLEMWCAKKKELPGDYALPSIKQGAYIRPEYLHHLDRLAKEIEEARPNLVVALGNTACWALLRSTKIGSIRGAISTSVLRHPVKTLPTYHPAAVCRLWSYRPIVIADLMKAKREAQFAEVRRPSRLVLVAESIEQIAEWFHRAPFPALAIDIETVNGQIEMISFARSRSDILVIKFITDVVKVKKAVVSARSYWSEADERLAWEWTERLLTLPCPKVFQNGMFDLQYIWKMAIRPTWCTEDTMLLAHSRYPEMLKGLGFLGSIHTDEPAWKLMRGKGSETEELKRDE
jgi:DNA polymerase